MNLLENSEYISDLIGMTPSRELAKKWGIGKTTVNEHRKLHPKGSNTREGLVASKQSNNGEYEATVTHHKELTLSDAYEWVRKAGFVPERYDITVSTNAYGNGLWSNKIIAKPKSRFAVEDINHDDLMRIVDRVSVAVTRPPVGKSNVESKIVISDLQIGKQGSRGGTAETLARGEYARNKAYEWLSRQNPARVTLFDGGDAIENFESGGNPMRTNDLSLPRQIEEYTYELARWVKMFQPDALVTVPSNHSAWRYGKQVLGLPSDDYGITVGRTVAHMTGTELVVPVEYEESVAHRNVGLVHGNQFAPGKAVDWWKGQAFGSNPVAMVDVLLFGHYHTFEMRMAGVNPLTGNQRWVIGLPTLDNGSDWYRVKVGVESKPGIVCFNMVDGVFDASSVEFMEIPF